jgi:hypothetical protein
MSVRLLRVVNVLTRPLSVEASEAPLTP